MQLLCFAGRGLEPAACRGIIAAADYLKCDKYTTTTLHYSDLYISWVLVIKVRSKDISATHYYIRQQSVYFNDDDDLYA